MNENESEQKSKFGNAKLKFDEFLKELQRIEEDQKHIIAETKAKGEAKIKEFESIIEHEEKTMKTIIDEDNKVEELRIRLKKLDQAVFHVNDFIRSEQGYFRTLNISPSVSVRRPTYKVLNDTNAVNKTVILICGNKIKRANDDLQKFLETECTLTKKTDDEDLIPKCEICLEKYDHNEHWQSDIR